MHIKKLSSAALALALSAGVSHAALTTTFVGGGTGSVTGDTMNAVGAVTIIDNDTTGGDLWNGGDTFTYLHEANQITSSFTATVRVIGQTAEANGRWGKAGINVRSDLANTASNAMAQVAAGLGSQVAAPSFIPTGGDHNPVPVRLAGRNQNDGNGGFEDPIQDAGGADIPNNVFPEGGIVNATWLSISWDSATNGFIAGHAPDVAGAPGVWSFSAARTDIPADADGWYVGLGYSAHGDLSFGSADPVTEGEHGVTFDNFSLVVVPEPSTTLLGAAALGLLALRRRRR